MSNKRIFRELEKNTGLLFFAGQEQVYSISESPRNYPFPRRYIAYDLGAAAVDAIIDSRLELNTLRTIRLRRLVEDSVALKKSTAQEIIWQRELQARILNNYSPEGPFNPN